jgi:hypothetical protein
MGKIKDYAHVLKRGMQNFSAVVEGNRNLFRSLIGTLPEDQKNEADRRYAICEGCPFNSFISSEVGFYQTTRTDFHCSLCSCVIAPKVMDMNETCGLTWLRHKADENGKTVLGIYGYNEPLWGPYKSETT